MASTANVVPTAPLADIIEEWRAERAHDFQMTNSRPNHVINWDPTATILAELSGVSERRVRLIRAREGNVSLDTTDKLLVAMDRVVEWYGRLAPYYGPIKVAGYEAHLAGPDEMTPKRHKVEHDRRKRAERKAA